ncbi:TPA: hypothetical protein I7138_08130 [Vibrio vulnificus]|nr:hypothetical protein [Vibrio vulnificus]
MSADTYTTKRSAQSAARRLHGKDYAKRYEVQETELGSGQWVILDKPVTTAQPTREERNGVKRPASGGLCAAVWDYLDTHPNCTAKQVREAATVNGWNVNNAMCELYTWRKFMGISGRVTA